MTLLNFFHDMNAQRQEARPHRGNEWERIYCQKFFHFILMLTFFSLSLVRVRQQNYLGEVSKKYKHASNRKSPAEYPCILIDAQNRIL